MLKKCEKLFWKKLTCGTDCKLKVSKSLFNKEMWRDGPRHEDGVHLQFQFTKSFADKKLLRANVVNLFSPPFLNQRWCAQPLKSW